MSRAAATRGLSFEKPDYYSIPANAKEVTEMSGTTLLRDASYKSPLTMPAHSSLTVMTVKLQPKFM